MSHQSAYRIVLRRPPGEFWSQPFGLGPWSVLQGALPDTGRRGYRTRSAICLPVCELALSLSFPEVQPRAPAVYNTIENPSVVFCGEHWKRRETKPTQCKSNRSQRIGSLNSQRLKTQHARRTSTERINFSWVQVAWETDENLRLQTSDPNAFNSVLKILKKIS